MEELQLPKETRSLDEMVAEGKPIISFSSEAKPEIRRIDEEP
jgi:hypothetical protein